MARAPEADKYAHDRAFTKYALPRCLHIAIAARNLLAIERFVGHVERVLPCSGPFAPVLIRAYEPPPSNTRLAIWQQPGAGILREELQVWVHVDDRRYRTAYAEALPHAELTGRVLDHVMNRRVARLKGFNYLRIVPISRGANSSSGGLSEKWAVAYHSTPEMIAKNRADPALIQFADLADIVKMMDLKTGGSLQDPVNDAQAWVTPRR